MRTIVLCLTVIALIACHGRSARHSQPASTKVGGPFENSDYSTIGKPAHIAAADTSPAWQQAGQKIVLTGTVFQPGGCIPAPGVMLYYYHTNTAGLYIHDPQQRRSMAPNKAGQTHGYIRGWVITDSLGKYYIYTIRPGVYPNRNDPAHVHMSLKEPNGINEYYIDEILFDDDTLLTAAQRSKLEDRGGSGIVQLVQQQGLLVARRNIVLGLHIPNYPAENRQH